MLASGGVEEMQLPPNASIGGILEILAAREGVWADAFNNNNKVLAAINHRMAQPEKSIYDGG